jgi:hypothetical protein
MKIYPQLYGYTSVIAHFKNDTDNNVQTDKHLLYEHN